MRDNIGCKKRVGAIVIIGRQKDVAREANETQYLITYCSK